VTVTVLVATPNVAATADANRRLKATAWAAEAVSVPPESDCVASSVVRTVVVGTPQAAATAKLLLDPKFAVTNESPHFPEKNENSENNLALLLAAQSGGVA
jgi:hypothetical protein